MKYECPKCCGTGVLLDCKHVKSGVCFACNGTGIRHRVKNTKVTKQVWIVECEGTTYPPFDNEVDAKAFADEVACMHLEPPVVKSKETFSYKQSRVKV